MLDNNNKKTNKRQRWLGLRLPSRHNHVEMMDKLFLSVNGAVMDRARWGRRLNSYPTVTETIILIVSIRRLIEFDLLFFSLVATAITYAPSHRALLFQRPGTILASQYNDRSAMTNGFPLNEFNYFLILSTNSHELFALCQLCLIGCRI